LPRAIRFASADWARLARVCKGANIEPSALVRDTANMLSALCDARLEKAATADWYKLGSAVAGLGSIEDERLREVATLVAELMYERLRPMTPRARRTAS
jgi:hypothetical protein